MFKEKFNELNIKNNITSCQKTQKFIKDTINFGYNNKEDILKDLFDEIEELKEELDSNNIDRIKEELGDVVFVLCNLANQYNLDLNESIEYSNKEFQRRFIYIEDKVGEKNIKNIKEKEILELWKEAKRNK